MSYPWPGEWLELHKEDYAVSPENLEECRWVGLLEDYVRTMLAEAGDSLDQARMLCEEADGPYMYLDTLEADKNTIDRLAAAESLQEL